MTGIILTQYNGKIIGPIAKLLGYLMNAIFEFLNMIKIPNIGLSIIIFTIVIYLLLMPLTIKQQKFSKLSAKMNPELQAIQKRYKDKKDNDSMMAMNAETKSCLCKIWCITEWKLPAVIDSDADSVCIVSCYL